jgi:hypothetical protein
MARTSLVQRTTCRGGKNWREKIKSRKKLKKDDDKGEKGKGRWMEEKEEKMKEGEGEKGWGK